MTNNHQPTPEFEQFLEWQIASAMRRNDRFAAPAAPTASRRYLVTAAIAVVSLLVGAGGVTASVRIGERQDKQTLVTQQETEIRLMEMQLAIAQKSLDEAKRRVSIGIADQGAAREADLARAEIMTKFEKLKLNLDEVRLSGKPVRDDLTSPKIQDRDFVAERLELDLRQMSAHVADAEAQLAAMTRRRDVGLATATAAAEAEVQRAKAMADLRVLQAQLELRKQFAEGKLTAGEAQRQRVLTVTAAELEAARVRYTAAEARFNFVQRQSRVGLATEVELLKAQLQMLETKQEIAVLEAKLKTIRDEF